MALLGEDEFERLVKSEERVRDLGEVFTPSATVQEMLDLLPTTMWAIHPSPTFLEPACGDGNFLVAILDRKLEQIGKGYASGKLPAGETPESAQFHALEAMASIYGVDISIDNVVGGTPSHEIGARDRMLTIFKEWSKEVLSKKLDERSLVLRSAEWIVEHNILVGNMLPSDINGKATGRDRIPLIEYTFESKSLSVSLIETKLGHVLDTEGAKTESGFDFTYGPTNPETFWSGKATSLWEAERVLAPKLQGPARNGTRRRS